MGKDFGVSSKMDAKCRICKEQFGEFLTLDSEVQIHEGESVSILDLFNKCTSLAAKLDDGMPQILCRPCFENLKGFDEFLRMACSSDREFRDLLTKSMALESSELGKKFELTHKQSKNNNDGLVKNINIKSMDKDGEDSGEAVILDGFSNSAALEINTEAVDSTEKSRGDDDSVSEDDERDGIFVSGDEREQVKEIETDIEIVRLQPKEPKITNDSKFIEGQVDVLDSETVSVCQCQCNQPFHSGEELVQHCAVHKSLTKYECQVCDDTFHTVYRYRDHMKVHRRERNFTCEYCDKSFRTRTNLRLHLMTHTNVRPYKCEICGKSFQQSSVLKTHLTLHVGKPIECEICKRRFSRSAHLNIHKRQHTGERPYQCRQCSNSYMQKSHLDRHVACVHLGVRFQCSECGKVYTKKSSLNAHVQQEHERNQVYSCEICVKEFKKQKALYYHRKTKHPGPQSNISAVK